MIIKLNFTTLRLPYKELCIGKIRGKISTHTFLHTMPINSEHTQVKDLNINRWTLFFNSPEIEKQFREAYFKKSIRGFRISFVVVTFLYAFFGFLDYYTSKAFFHEFSIVRLGIVTPVLVSVFLASFHSKFKNFWQTLVASSYLIGGIGIVYMLITNPVNIFYYGGLFLIFMAGYFFIKLHFIYAVTPGILIVLFYNIGTLFFKNVEIVQVEQLIITNTFFISANIIAIVALYNTKRMEREEFVHLHLLSEQQEKIKSINESLESNVKDRTHLLETRNKALNDEITRRKQIEKKLIQAKYDAEESDRLKSAFLANMSHEIRTPMNGIIGFLDLISDPELTKDKQEHYLDIIRQSGTRLLQTINDIVELSKIEAGELIVNTSKVNLGKTFTYISQFFSKNFKDKNLEFKIPDKLESFCINTDSNKLESILINLIKNSLKFTNQGYVEVGVEALENMLNFYVKDTGVGIPKNRQAAIFDRFVQADLSLTRGYEGSGLGLSICKAYVELLDGGIWVESEENNGTTFYFTINYSPVEITNLKTQKPTKMTDEVITKKQYRILVAEDDEVSYNLLYTILNNDQIEIIWAKNGVEAVDIFLKHANISLIIMDIKMPVMDGIKATNEIRKIDKKVPIVAQTAFALSGDKEIALEAGCNDYLSKPLKREDLTKVIEKYLPLKNKLLP